jgi:hypothetical protein
MLGQKKQVNTKALLGFKKFSIIDPVFRVITQNDFADWLLLNQFYA